MENDFNKWERIEILGKEMDYLRRFFESQNHKFIFEKAVQLLYDIVKAHELGWDLSLMKMRIDDEGERQIDQSSPALRFGIDRLSENNKRIDHKQLRKINAASN